MLAMVARTPTRLTTTNRAPLHWVNPDCGLKTRGYAEVGPSLRNLVAARDEVVEGL